MTEQEENYIYLASCVANFNKALKILQEIKLNENKSSFIEWSFELALIEYSKPFTSSHGNIKRWKLDEKHIPINYKNLHKRIIKARNKIHAHSDLTIKEAKLIIRETENRKIVLMIQNVIDSTTELKNIDEIIDLIKKTLENLYLRGKNLEKDLPENSS